MSQRYQKLNREKLYRWTIRKRRTYVTLERVIRFGKTVGCEACDRIAEGVRRTDECHARIDKALDDERIAKEAERSKREVSVNLSVHEPLHTSFEDNWQEGSPTRRILSKSWVGETYISILVVRKLNMLALWQFRQNVKEHCCNEPLSGIDAVAAIFIMKNVAVSLGSSQTSGNG